jgi:hypothetical protein
VDYVLTSPPYLNAIDYMRGHRLSLIWLGYKIAVLRNIRSNTIGIERGPDTVRPDINGARETLGDISTLCTRSRAMIDRYICDVQAMMSEIVRVLVPGKRATLVVGNSCIRGVFINNAKLAQHAAKKAGLTLIKLHERCLPQNRRYLPTTVDGTLSKRMRTETVLTFRS